MAYTLSGNPLIDALIKTNDYAPPRNTTPGTPVTVYYSFEAAVSGYNLTTLDAAQQATVNQIVAEYEAVAGIDFVYGNRPGTTNTDITFYIGSPGTGGEYRPMSLGLPLQNGGNAGGYIQISSNHVDNFEFLTRHELGHGLGLDHPANYSGFESAPHLDTNAITAFSVMGYGDDGTNTLTANDIAALRYMYGAPGGIGSTPTVAGTTSGNDNYTGTGGNDNISGLAGNDALYGGDGNDTMNGNEGADTVNGNLGADDVSGGKGNDDVQGGKGNDTVYGNIGNDTVNGNIGDDIVRGGQNEDIVRGGQGNDQLYGDLGNDTLMGDLGNDILIGGSGNDVFVYTAGDDVINDFENGVDTIQIVGFDVSSFSEIQPFISSVGSTTIISVGAGTSLTLIGVSSSALDASDFTFVG